MTKDEAWLSFVKDLGSESFANMPEARSLFKNGFEAGVESMRGLITAIIDNYLNLLNPDEFRIYSLILKAIDEGRT